MKNDKVKKYALYRIYKKFSYSYIYISYHIIGNKRIILIS